MPEKGKIKAIKSLGQNFLINPAIAKKIVEATNINHDDVVVEVGAGSGNLTLAITEKTERVLAVELDERLVEILKKRFEDQPQLTVITGDALKLNFDEEVNRIYGSNSYKIVANIPYYITTPLLFHFLEDMKNWLILTVMVQKEVAERILSPAGSKAYGAITAAIALSYEVKLVCKVSSGSFYPRPEVDSAVIQVLPRQSPLVDIEFNFFHLFLKTVFGKRRKTLINALVKSNLEVKKEAVLALLLKRGWNEKVRAEELSPVELAEFARDLKEIIQK